MKTYFKLINYTQIEGPCWDFQRHAQYSLLLGLKEKDFFSETQFRRALKILYQKYTTVNNMQSLRPVPID